MEFGFVTMTNHGFRMHCVHYIFQNELQTTSGYDAHVKQLYAQNIKSVNNAFVHHFGLDVDEFMVAYKDKCDQSEVEGPSKNALHTKSASPKTPDKIHLDDDSMSKTGSKEVIDVKVVNVDVIQMMAGRRESITLSE